MVKVILLQVLDKTKLGILVSEGIVNLSSLRDKNRLSVAYTKFWTQLTLVHSLNARSRSVL